MKSTSCGVLILVPAKELLLCHSTGNRHWDIPKGAPDEGERWIDAAVREAREECGRRLEPAALLELGRFAYRPDKDLALYAVLSERFDTACCVCSSFFTDRHGHERPEMDGFRWTPFADVPRHCARRMAEVLTTTISLPEVLARVEARASVLAHELQGRAPGAAAQLT